MKEEWEGTAGPKKLFIKGSKQFKYFDQVESQAESKIRYEPNKKYYKNRRSYDKDQVKTEHVNVLNQDIWPRKKVYIVVPTMKASQSQQVFVELPKGRPSQS